MEDNKFLIPANVSAKFEFFAGFGFKELFIVMIALFISISLYLLLGMPTKTVYEEPPSQIEIERLELKVNKDGFIEVKKEIINPIIRLIIGVFITGITFLFTKKVEGSNLSILNYISGLKEFQKKQKVYYYVYNSGGSDK